MPVNPPAHCAHCRAHAAADCRCICHSAGPFSQLLFAWRHGEVLPAMHAASNPAVSLALGSIDYAVVRHHILDAERQQTPAVVHISRN